MGVELGIEIARGVVAEGGGDDLLSAGAHHPARSRVLHPCLGGILLDPGERRLHRPVVRLDDAVVAADQGGDGDGLRGGEGEVAAGTVPEGVRRPCRGGRASVPEPSGTLPSRTCPKSVRIDRTLQPELFGALAGPAARRTCARDRPSRNSRRARNRTRPGRPRRARRSRACQIHSGVRPAPGSAASPPSVARPPAGGSCGSGPAGDPSTGAAPGSGVAGSAVPASPTGAFPFAVNAVPAAVSSSRAAAPPASGLRPWLLGPSSAAAPFPFPLPRPLPAAGEAPARPAAGQAPARLPTAAVRRLSAGFPCAFRVRNRHGVIVGRRGDRWLHSLGSICRAVRPALSSAASPLRGTNRSAAAGRATYFRRIEATGKGPGNFR